MAAGRSPFSEVPRRQIVNPEVGLRLGPRPDANLSARRLNRTGPLPPHHGLLATPGRERRSGPKLSRIPFIRLRYPPPGLEPVSPERADRAQ
jgi:hypothetical protein